MILLLFNSLQVQIFVFRALIECNLDGGKKADASQIAVTASTFIKQHVPHLYKQVFGLIVSCCSTVTV